MTVTQRIIATMDSKDTGFFKELGARIAHARKERGLTQQALAEQLGIAQQTLAHYEVARARIAASLLPRVAELLDLSLDELLVGRPTIRLPGKRGPASRIEQQIDAVTRLPKASQKAVWQLLDAMIAQHANG
ncbi:helix-turn-helix domain-containing protein [Sphingomonas sp.]|uniref:helix-turn-helix domain-containing protein n=1 Tax=Sphingomonas sp. TaxID=28214 RepID=UPI003D6CC211